ncbi:YceI family protein [Neptuniibacter sp. QD37_11]|uniref:YceI family protein n=1 Tax=Neptuniibacter sp. QD37_11 TaxID=3398209 RepID=UPI0039F60F62
MKKLIAATLLTAATLTPTMASAADYIIDTKGAHASVNFKVPHLGYSFIKGQFRDFEGYFSYQKDQIELSKITVNLDITSIDSNHSERDKHLKGKKFLDANKYSTAVFESNKVTDLGNGKLKVEGTLSMRGQSKPLVIDAEFIGEGKDPWGGYRAGFMGAAKINFEDYGIIVMGPSSYAELELHIEGIRK